MRVSDISQGKIVLLVPLLLLTLIGLFVIQAGHDTVLINGRKAATFGKPRLVEAYGRLPLAFEANQGQTDPKVKFFSRRGKDTLFLTAAEAVLALAEPQPTTMSSKARPAAQLNGGVLRIQLVGANPQPSVQGLERLPGKVNYFIGNDPKKWQTDIPTYRKVKYNAVYPGVDLVYYGNQGRIEYDFVVSPGADPKAITLSFQGTRRLEIDSQGDLLLHMGWASPDAEAVRLPGVRKGQAGNRWCLRAQRHASGWLPTCVVRSRQASGC